MAKKRKGKKLVFMNEKGGAGKTVGARETAGILGEQGNKILLIDCDFQRNLTTSFNVQAEKTLLDIMLKREEIKDCIIKINENIDLVPGSIEMRNLDEYIKGEFMNDFIMDKQIKSIEEDYDYIIIDCRPDMRKIEMNALVCADVVLTPLEPHYFSLDGFDILEGFIDSLKDILKLDLKHYGYFSRVPVDKSFIGVLDDLKKDYGSLILNSFIRENLKIKEASMSGQFIIDYSGRSNGAIDFQNLVKELKKNDII